MRRSLLGLLTVAAIAGLLITTGCSVFERSNVLRVVKINRGTSLHVDVADWWVYKDPSDPTADPEQVFTMRGETTEVELQYVEIGAGLPTWTPYEVIISKATIAFTRTQPDAEPFDPPSITVPMDFNVPVDPTGKKTSKAVFEVAPEWWVERNFEANDPTEVGDIVVADAKITFTGVDSVSGRQVQAIGRLDVQFADFYDDPSSPGR
jgi:hypothetical protein